MDKIWLQNYSKDMPENIGDIPYSTLVDLIIESEKKFSDKIAFTNLNTDISFSESAHLSNSFAAYLQNQLDLKKGDKIGIMLPNLHTFPVCFFGALKCGLIVVNINPLYKYREIQDIVTDANLKILSIKF